MDVLGFGLHQVAAFLLVLARVGGIFTVAPVFGSSNVTPAVRVTIAVALAFVFLPLADYGVADLSLITFGIAVVKEAAVGLAMGFMVSLVFTAIQMAGAYIDLQVGLGFANVVDPMTSQRNAVLAQFQNMAATLLFLSINAHHLVIRGLAESFSILPLGHMCASPAVASGMSAAMGGVFLAALKIATPVVGVIFLTDVSLGILSRTVPQLNVFVVGLPAKLGVGLLALAVTIPVALGVMTGLFTGIAADMTRVLTHLAP